MERYSLLKYKDRRNTNSVKWDDLEEKFGRTDLLPAWVADMDIEAPECVREALTEYVTITFTGTIRFRSLSPILLSNG